MNQEQKIICRIVGAALLGGEIPACDVSDWKEIHQEFVDQTILAIPGTILKQLPMPQEIFKQWKLEMITGSARSIRLMDDQNELVRLLEQQAIPYVILKGVAAAKYYPEPWLRTMGDVDLIVPQGYFDQTKQLMLQNGFAATDDDQEGNRHAAFAHNGVHYELHRYFSITEDDAGRKLDEIVYQGIENSGETQIMNYAFRTLPEPVNGIVLLAHIRQHLSSGLGLRQMADWFMFVRQELHDEQWPAFRQMSDQIGLTQLAKAATRIGQLYFGLDESISWCNDVDAVICEDLMDHIFRSGNFGHKDVDNSSAVFAMTRLRQHFFRTLQENGERNWKALKSHAWLKPFAWLYQLCRYARLGLTSRRIRAKVGEDRAHSRDLADLMKKLKL